MVASEVLLSEPRGDSQWPGRGAVIGAGTMGAGIAQLSAAHGTAVSLADASPERSAAALERLRASAQGFEKRGLLGAGAAERVGRLVRAADSVVDAAHDAELLIEAVVEDPRVKREVYVEIEAVASADAVLATNTSAIPIRDLGSDLSHPGRFLGTHWFNPPQWVPCVEVIPGPSTTKQVLERVHVFFSELGKRPVTVGDAAGFVANRIQFAMFKEAVSCVADGVAGPEEVDEVVRSSFGFRLPFFGPFAIADMAGLDVYAGAYEALESGLGPRFAAPEQLLALIEAGRIGTKSGGGFGDLPAESVPGMIERRDTTYVALSRLIERLESESGS